MKNSAARQMALGGMMAALAVVIMCLGGLIPVATYVCPMLCAGLMIPVMGVCTRRVCWAWYGAVAFLGVLLGPDKEAALIFLFLGYYPIIQPDVERLPGKILPLLCKLGLCNLAAVGVFLTLTYVLGLDVLLKEWEEFGFAVEALFLLAENVIFLLADRLLHQARRKFWKK